jgi:hypothetical protein
MKDRNSIFLIALILLSMLFFSSCITYMRAPPFRCAERADTQECDARSKEGEGRVQVKFQNQNLITKAAPIPEEALDPDVLPGESFTLVTNFEVFEVIDGKEELRTEFDPPFELRVEYSAEQWKRSVGNEGNSHRQPWLVYWDAKGKKWVEFENVVIDPVDGNKENGGFLVVEISSWGDPPIGIV